VIFSDIALYYGDTCIFIACNLIFRSAHEALKKNPSGQLMSELLISLRCS